MKKTLIATRKILTELQDGFWISYWLTEEMITDGKAYGITLEKQRDSTVVEEEQTNCFSYRKDKVTSLIQQLAKENVTPMALLDVVENFISSHELRMELDDTLVS